MQCPNCGATILKNDVTCKKCGYRLNEVKDSYQTENQYRSRFTLLFMVWATGFSGGHLKWLGYTEEAEIRRQKFKKAFVNLFGMLVHPWLLLDLISIIIYQCVEFVKVVFGGYSTDAEGHPVCYFKPKTAASVPIKAGGQQNVINNAYNSSNHDNCQGNSFEQNIKNKLTQKQQTKSFVNAEGLPENNSLSIAKSVPGMGMLTNANIPQSTIQLQSEAESRITSSHSEEWECSCGTKNTGNFCMNCGTSKPQVTAINNPPVTWQCSCGEMNTENFCGNCGKPKTEIIMVPPSAKTLEPLEEVKEAKEEKVILERVNNVPSQNIAKHENKEENETDVRVNNIPQQNRVEYDNMSRTSTIKETNEQPVRNARENGNYQKWIIALLVAILALLLFIILRPSASGVSDPIKPPLPPEAPPVNQGSSINTQANPAPAPIKTPFSKETVAYVIGTDVNIRTMPSMNSKVVGSYELGEKVTVLETSNEWAKVRRHNGQEFYISREFIGSEEDLNRRTGKQTTAPNIPAGAIVNAYHSSADQEGNYIHSGRLAVDGNTNTCWSEGVKGLGIGENIEIHFNGNYRVNGMNIWIGHQKSQQLYYENARPTAVRILGSDGSNEVYNLNDTYGMQRVNFKHPITVNKVKVAVERVALGNKYEDTCIAEVNFF